MPSNIHGLIRSGPLNMLRGVFRTVCALLALTVPILSLAVVSSGTVSLTQPDTSVTISITGQQEQVVKTDENGECQYGFSDDQGEDATGCVIVLPSTLKDTDANADTSDVALGDYDVQVVNDQTGESAHYLVIGCDVGCKWLSVPWVTINEPATDSGSEPGDSTATGSEDLDVVQTQRNEPSDTSVSIDEDQIPSSNDIAAARDDWWIEFSTCAPCFDYAEDYAYAVGEIRQYNEELGALQGRVWGARKAIAHNTGIGVRPEDVTSDRGALADMKKEILKLRRLIARLELAALKIKIKWRHCVATRCSLKNTLLNSTRPDQLGYPDDGETPSLYFFVNTICDPCKKEAVAINDWILEQYQDWLAQYLYDNRGKPYAFDTDYLLETRGQAKWVNFLVALEYRKSDLRDCERQCDLQDRTPEIDPSIQAYLAPSIADQSCKEAIQVNGHLDWLRTFFAEGTVQQADPGPLPPACTGSDLAIWNEYDCGQRTCDPALSDNTDVEIDVCVSGRPCYPAVADATVIEGESCGSGSVDIDDTGLHLNTGLCSGELRTSQLPLTGTPDDNYFTTSDSIQSGLEDSWSLSRIGLYQSGSTFDKGDGKGVVTTVAVVDSGLDYLHPDLAGMVWTNEDELPDNGEDDDGNGFVDDLTGWNFVRKTGDVMDTNGHGTLVAGIIGAATNNGLGIAGVNPWANLMPVKVTDFLGVGNSVDVAGAIVYAVNNGARVINISLGGRNFSPTEEAAIRYASEKDVVTVVAAGNLNTNTEGFWPAGLDGVITVAAIDPSGERAAYSNWGQAVDIAAPGTNILSLRARYTDLMFFAEKDYEPESHIVGKARMLYHATGTSFAAPFVSGVASLLFSLDPDLTAGQVKRMILNSAVDIANPGIDLLTGYGLLDAGAALEADPDFYIDVGITGVALAGDGKSIQIIGTADADRFKSGRLELSKGEAPEKWKSVGKKIKKPVTSGELGRVKTRDLQGSSKWTIRATVNHEDGRERVSRFLLSLE